MLFAFVLTSLFGRNFNPNPFLGSFGRRLQMITSRILSRTLVFGLIAEAVCLAVSFGLYSLKHGREPMEPPFNWTATVLQMPSILVSAELCPYVNYSGACQSSLTFFVQAVLWAAIGFAFQAWRARKAK